MLATRPVIARGFGTSIVLLVCCQLLAGFLSLDFEPIGMADFNYTTYLPDYLYPPAEFEWNPGQYLPMCEVCPQVQPGDEGPMLLGADEAESLVEMDSGEIEIIMKGVVESKENVMQQQQ